MVRMRRVTAVLRSAVAGYGRHADSQFAAALAYRALFSLVPFVALLAALLDAFLPAGAREDVVEWLLGALPGTELQASVDRELESSGALTTLAGLIAFGTLIWSATGMTGSLRTAFSRDLGSRPASGVRSRRSCATSWRWACWSRSCSRASGSRC